MKKTYQRFIRINGKLKKSPHFARSSDADHWYMERLREKQHLTSGLPMPLDARITLNAYFKTTWLPLRKQEYTKATWGSDEQRYRDYAEELIGSFKVSRINTLQIRNCLLAVTQKHGMSINTRNKVRSLLSKIFGDSMLEKRPLRTDNPALGIKFKDPRIGKKKPNHISKEALVQKYLTAAREIGQMPFAIASTVLMSALRKSELIALRWKDLDVDDAEINVRARFVQAEKKIMAGTKAGREESRSVGIPDALVSILGDWRKVSKYPKDNDFIFYSRPGGPIHPRQVNHILDRVSLKSGVKASPHALRHSFGRWFVANGGSLKALQSIMGHSNYTTTEIYSELVAEQVKRERNRVSFEVEK